MSPSDAQNLQKTPLHALHIEAGAKLVPFAGYSMPLHYSAGIVQEHLHTRKQAALFDVSHMGQVALSGDNPAAALESLIPSDVTQLKPGHSRCSALLNKRGGIIDDMIVARPPEEDSGTAPQSLLIVFNATRKQADCAYLEKHLSGCHLTRLDQQALLALQGPSASTVMARRFGDAVLTQPFMSVRRFAFEGTPVLISRCGYTGEDGYEISIPAEQAIALANSLLSADEVELAGLGARDSLRMEAGLCLYGSDIDETTTPVEAGLSWMISKTRRERGGFFGAEVILKQLQEGAPRRRVGIRPQQRVIARGGSPITAGNTAGTGDVEVGSVTSGGFSPTLQHPIAIGYVSAQYAEAGSELGLCVRGKIHAAQVTALPFVPTHYYPSPSTRRTLTN